ncbi:TatD family [Dactylonectria macrodidyma]|uniref:TatD family n=1 Tax=Dactylonectria macrodidyma TaxID=307937 RepID=A0A9P9IY54_9HYPO|nr:TatD family [Dactylonectria macrodidyma]
MCQLPDHVERQDTARRHDALPFPWHLTVCDAHCHPTDTMASVAEFSAMRSVALTVMATRSQDQDLVADVAVQHPAPDRKAFLAAGGDGSDGQLDTFVVPAFGWHPWFSYQLYDDQVPEPTYRPATPGPGSDQTPEISAEDAAAIAKAAHYGSVLAPAPSPSFLASLPTPIPISSFISPTRTRLLAHPLALVGEIGLDKAFRLPQSWDAAAEDARDAGLTPGGREGRLLSPHRVRLEHQRTVLAAQLRLAAEMRRAVSVHGVQAHGVLHETLAATWKGHEREVVSRRKRRMVAQGAEDFSSDSEDEEVADEKKPYPPRICLHSFSAGVEVLKQYLHPAIPARIFISLSSAVNLSTDAGRAKTDDVLRAMPDDRILVESDLHTAGESMDAALEDMYRQVCEVKGWTLEEGVTRLSKNYEEFIYG